MSSAGKNIVPKHRIPRSPKPDPDPVPGPRGSCGTKIKSHSPDFYRQAHDKMSARIEPAILNEKFHLLQEQLLAVMEIVGLTAEERARRGIKTLDEFDQQLAEYQFLSGCMTH